MYLSEDSLQMRCALELRNEVPELGTKMHVSQEQLEHPNQAAGHSCVFIRYLVMRG